MAHRGKNRNGLSVAQGIDPAIRDPLARSGGAALAPPARNGVGGLSLSASPPESQSAAAPSLSEPKGLRRPTHQEIERRAYELYLARQGRPGTPLEDWVRAERELSSRS